MNVTGREAGVLDDGAEKKREAAEEMRSLMTSQQRCDGSQSAREAGDARQASIMMSGGRDRDGLQWRRQWERKGDG